LLPDVDGAAEHYTEILGQGTIIPTNAIMIVERTHYFAKPGLAAEVLDQRRKACADLVADGTLSIVARSFFTTVKANTRNTLIATYEFAQRNDWEFRATAIAKLLTKMICESGTVSCLGLLCVYTQEGTLT
jgi:hypothetical protein